MPVDVNTWIAVTSLLANVIAIFPRDTRQRTQEQEAALVAVSAAYHETAGYLKSRESTGRSEDREWAIAQKWDRAAILLKKYDRGLSERLGKKSCFWADGGAWSEEAVAEANIGLLNVWQEVKSRLGDDASE